MPKFCLRHPVQVVQAKVPDLHGLEDISEYVAGGMGGGASDSELEDEESKITLPEDYVGRGNVKSQKRWDTAQRVARIGRRSVFACVYLLTACAFVYFGFESQLNSPARTRAAAYA